MSDVERQIEQWRHHLDGSEWLGQADVQELENHLRDQMQHLQTAGLSDEEAFFVGRHRLGDRAALEEEFAKVNPHRRLASRFYWMIVGIVSYYIITPLAYQLSTMAGYSGYAIGLRGTLLIWFTRVATLMVYAAVGFLLLRFFASRWYSRIMAHRIIGSICVAAFATGANALLVWTMDFANRHVWNRVVPPSETQMAIAQSWTSIAWVVMWISLLAGALAIFARQNKEQVEIR